MKDKYTTKEEVQATKNLTLEKALAGLIVHSKEKAKQCHFLNNEDGKTRRFADCIQLTSTSSAHKKPPKNFFMLQNLLAKNRNFKVKNTCTTILCEPVSLANEWRLSQVSGVIRLSRVLTDHPPQWT